MRACDYNIYFITYDAVVREGVSHPAGEIVYTGGKHIEPRVYRVVAPTEAFAMTAFRRYHPQERVVAIENCGALNDIVTLA